MNAYREVLVSRAVRIYLGMVIALNMFMILVVARSQIWDLVGPQPSVFLPVWVFLSMMASVSVGIGIAAMDRKERVRHLLAGCGALAIMALLLIINAQLMEMSVGVDSIRSLCAELAGSSATLSVNGYLQLEPTFSCFK